MSEEDQTHTWKNNQCYSGTNTTRHEQANEYELHEEECVPLMRDLKCTRDLNKVQVGIEENVPLRIKD